MSVRSMTGFARIRKSAEAGEVVVSVKSVNHRGLLVLTAWKSSNLRLGRQARDPGRQSEHRAARVSKRMAMSLAPVADSGLDLNSTLLSGQRPSCGRLRGSSRSPLPKDRFR